MHFNLAENRRDEQAPFATYTDRLGASGKAQHQPLGQALKEYAGAASKSRLLSLLVPVLRAAERCEWLRAMVATGEVFHPLRWSIDEAFRLLGDVPELETRARRKPKKVASPPESRAKEAVPPARRRSRSRRGKKK